MIDLSFFSMGGYGVYVWSAYSLVTVTLLWAVLHTLIKQHNK